MRLILITFLLLMLSAPTYAQPQVSARVFVQPEGQIYAGQQFTLYVEVKTDSWFLSAPDFPEIAFENALAIRPEQLGTNFVDKVGQKTYAGLRQRFLVNAHKAGKLTIPAYTMSFSVSGEYQKPVPVTVKTEPVSVSIVMPPGLSGIENIAVTPTFKITEHFNPPLSDLKTGDAFTRSITLEADDALGFTLPSIVFEEIEGLSIYTAEPRFDDDVVRGEAIGRRTDSASYILQKDGAFELPPVEVQWFDLTEGVLKDVSTAPVSFQVQKNLNLKNAVILNDYTGAKDRILKSVVSSVNWLVAHLMQILWIGGILYIAVRIWKRYGQSVIAETFRLRAQIIQSEVWAYAFLLWSCLFRTSGVIKNNLRKWLSFNGNEPFRKKMSWQNIQGSYANAGARKLNRVQLCKDLIVFRSSKRINRYQKSRVTLNP